MARRITLKTFVSITSKNLASENSTVLLYSVGYLSNNRRHRNLSSFGGRVAIQYLEGAMPGL